MHIRCLVNCGYMCILHYIHEHKYAHMYIHVHIYVWYVRFFVDKRTTTAVFECVRKKRWEREKENERERERAQERDRSRERARKRAKERPSAHGCVFVCKCLWLCVMCISSTLHSWNINFDCLNFTGNKRWFLVHLERNLHLKIAPRFCILCFLSSCACLGVCVYTEYERVSVCVCMCVFVCIHMCVSACVCSRTCGRACTCVCFFAVSECVAFVHVCVMRECVTASIL